MPNTETMDIAQSAATFDALPKEPDSTPAAAPAAQPAAPAAAPATTEPAAPETAPTPPPAPKTAAEKALAGIEGVLKKPEAKKTDAPELDEAGMEKVIKANPKAWRVYEGYKKSTAAKTAELEKKIAELSAKPNPTAADDTRLKALEKQLQDRDGEAKTLKQRLAERDYRESNEYQANFVKPFQNSFLKAREFTSRLQVLAKVNENDEVTSPARQATPADFDKVFNAGPQERYVIAKELFGPDMAIAIVRRAEDLDGLNEKAVEAISSHSANYEKIHAERETRATQEREQFNQFKTESQKALEQKYPEYFSADHYKDQPEFQAALKSGYEFLDNAEQNMEKMSPDDRAATVAVIRSRAAAFPLLYTKLTAMQAENETLKSDLQKYRASDPGSAQPKPGDAPKVEEIGGIAEMTARFDKAQ